MEKCNQIIYWAFAFTLFHFSSLFAADFTGSIQMNGCSGALVRFNFSHDTDRALVLSAGHCSVLPVETGQFAYHYKNRSRVTFLNADGTLNPVTARTAELVYASVTDTDISIYALKESYQDIKNRTGVSALKISGASPQIGDTITIISGQLQKSYSCNVAYIAYRLMAGSFIWKNSIRYSDQGCDVVGGTSGAPLLNTQREIIGINNTGTGSGAACSSNVPCEISQDGVIYYSKRGTNYGQQTYLIATCFNSQRQFDLTVPSCQLYH